MANPYLDQIELPSGSVYDLVDSGARDLIAAINNWDYVVCTDAANTPKDITWDDEGTVITGTLVASADTMYKIYLVPASTGSSDNYAEYITVNPSGSTYTWEMFGSIALPDMSQYVKNKSGHTGGTAGDLAYKNTASGSTTVAVPKTYTTTFTGKEKSVSVSGTPSGSVSSSFTGSDTYFKTASEVATGASFSGSSMTSTGNFTPSGSISVGTGTANYTPAGTNTASSVSGSCSVTPSGSISVGTGTANYTPAGTNASSSVSGSCSVTPSGSISVGTGTANYTPAGSVSVSSAGSTTTIKNPTAKTVVTDMSVANPSSTTATGELVYCSVSGTKLSLKKFVETTGDSITTANQTVKTGDASYSFSGTGAELKFTGSSSSGTISGTAAAQTFSGTGAQLKFTGSSSSGTISGTAAAQTFSGTGAELKFTGSQGSVSVSGTTTGSVNVTKGTVEVTPSATGTAANKYTPGGSVSSSFSGTALTSTGTYTPEATSVSTTTATTEDKTVAITVS